MLEVKGGTDQMKHWNLVIDLARCHDCNDCFLADKDEFVGNDFPPYSVAQPWSGHRWMNIHRKERGQFPIVQVAYLPQPCMHCADAPCMKKAPEGAIYHRPDGLVIIDPVKAKDHRELVAACPYGSIYYNEEAGLPQKCTGCAHLLDEGWTETRCSQVCPTGAISLVLAEDEEWGKKVKAENLQAYKADLGTHPRVLYKNLERWEKVFVSASLAYKDTDECADGATITVHQVGATVAQGKSGTYGEFVVDGLEPGAEYEVRIEAKNYQVYATKVKLDNSLNLGLILLEKS
jgi:Fe-S-cluster-containing dehydrogenase component